MSILKPSLASYLFSGALALVASVVLGGCKFGNYGGDDRKPQGDPLTGYYGTAAQTLTFCAAPSATNCVASAVNRVPAEIEQVMSDPVGFLLENEATGQAKLVDSRGSGSVVPVFLDADKKRFSFLGSSAEIPIFSWTLEEVGGCTRQLYLQAEGALSSVDAGKPVTQAVSLKGRLGVKLELTYLFAGGCADDLAAARACYLSSADCGGADPVENASRQREVQELFNPYIQSGALTVAEIGTAEAVAYTVEYE